MNRKENNTSGFPEFAGMDLPAMEKTILAFWEEQSIFKKSVDSRPAGNPFVFYEGPPSANGKPGIHHVMSRAIKDLFCRYKTLQGFRVERKAGWDTHGLPVELGVEKQLGITKNDIGTKITIEEYNRLCREDVMKFTNIWNDLTLKMGYWVDMDNPYITYENGYIENLWALLKMLYEKGLLYKGYTIQPYSPAAGTGLSSHELNQPGCYRDVKDVSAVAMFKLGVTTGTFASELDLNGSIYFLAWTTTPWTLPSNTALAVGKDITYVAVKTFHPTSKTRDAIVVILAKDLLHKYFPEKNSELKFEDFNVGDKSIPFEIINEYSGQELKGIDYQQLLPYAQPTDGEAFRVIIGDFVTTTDGTGIVHIAPSFGADDMRVAKQNGIGSLTLVDKQGKFTDEVDDPQFPLKERYIKEAYYTDAEKDQEFHLQKEILRIEKIIPDLKGYMSVDELIVLKLKNENRLFKSEKYDHSYPHCWRTDKPVIYYPLDSWFIKTTAYKDKLIALNKTINWKPKSTGEGRFGQWLENIVDWNLSRSRYWGTPLPIWRTEDKTEEKCIGSIAELRTEVEKAKNAGLNETLTFEKDIESVGLHKPFVDDIVLLSDSGKPMYREADVIDVWFESGAMPYAQWEYPLRNKEKFEQSFPADFIAEGVDQTRGWFFTLHVLGTLLFDSVAYKNVVSNGLLLDKAGNKMSKRLGNVVDPFDTLEKYGADATRWYMIRNSDPWDNLKFDLGGIADVTRSHYGTLYNTYSFFALYANIDKWQMDELNLTPHADKPELDRWIISRLQTLVEEVTNAYNDYEPTKAARYIESFVDIDLSNWYVRLSRRRFWKGEMNDDKKAAYETLYECLMVVGQFMSPVSPFFSEWLYKNLTDTIRTKAIENNTPLRWESVHLSYFSTAEKERQDKDLEERMELAQKACSLILSLRKREKIKVRQPLQKMLIPVADENRKQQLQKVESYILNEVNVKEIVYVHDTSDMVKKKIKPNFKSLGKRAGQKIKAIQEAVNNFTKEDITAIEQNKTYALKLDDGTFDLTLEDVEITSEDIEGWLVANDGALTVALDITLTDALRSEGNAREFVNKIQNLRKDKGFQVLDRIKVSVMASDTLRAAINQFNDYISNEILAKEIALVDSLDAADEIEYNDETIRVNVVVL